MSSTNPLNKIIENFLNTRKSKKKKSQVRAIQSSAVIFKKKRKKRVCCRIESGNFGSWPFLSDDDKTIRGAHEKPLVNCHPSKHFLSLSFLLIEE